MYCKGSVEASIRHYYLGALHESGYTSDVTEELLKELDFDALTEAVKLRARDVPAYELLEDGKAVPDYTGQSLFHQNAAMIYRDNNLCTGNPAEIEGLVVNRSKEVWIQEDGNMFTASCVSVYFLEGDFTTVYREIVGFPFQHGGELNLRAMTDELKKLYGGESVPEE